MSRLAYRRDIDGLRALAIGLVVAYHFRIPFVGGGYIGVDIFFVISGFLIASILARDSTLSLAGLAAFYLRRVKRLLPAFVIVAVATTVVASVLLLPEDFEAFLKSVRESLLFRANVFFARATTGYFAADAATFPWLHTWSLSVEWQFYAVFPPAVWLAGKASMRRSANAALSGALVVVAFVGSAWMTMDQPANAYFSAKARLFEFLIGAGAASVTPPRIGHKASSAIATACILAILALAILFTSASRFPGLNAGMVCVAVFIFLLVGRDMPVLASDAAAFIGRRSYATYLWHWPVVAFLASVQHEPTAFEIVGWIVAIFIAADLTHRCVEAPALRARWKPSFVLALYAVLPLVLVSIAMPWVARHDGFPERFGDEVVHAYSTLKGFDAFIGERCDGEPGMTDPCVLGDRRGHVTAVLIGDSHARHLAPFVDLLARDARVRLSRSTNNLCLQLEGVTLPEQFPFRVECGEAVERTYRMIRERPFDFVVIAERWHGYPVDQLEKLDDALGTIVATGAIPVLLAQTAEDGENSRDCFYRPAKLRQTRVDDCELHTDNGFAADAQRAVSRLFDTMQRKYPTLRVIDPRAVQCTHARCLAVISGAPIYSDSHHLEPFGSAMLGHAYLRRFGNPLSP